MKEFFNILKILIAVDIGIFIFCYLEDNIVWIYNTQIAFFSVVFIVFGSFIGYSNMVRLELQKGNVGEDILKKYEDPYNMDDEENKIKNDKLEKELNKKLKWYEVILFSFKGGFNFIRIIGYVFLVIGFLWLKKSNIFDYLSFLFGISIVPSLVLIYLFILKKRIKE